MGREVQDWWVGRGRIGGKGGAGLVGGEEQNRREGRGRIGGWGGVE